MSPSHDELIALCGPYAMGALDDPEKSQVGDHLGECWACRQRVLEFEETFAEGAKVLPPVHPSADAKARLLERISGQRGALPAAQPAAPAPGVPIWAAALIAVIAFALGVVVTLALQSQ